MQLQVSPGSVRVCAVVKEAHFTFGALNLDIKRRCITSCTALCGSRVRLFLIFAHVHHSQAWGDNVHAVLIKKLDQKLKVHKFAIK